MNVRTAGALVRSPWLWFWLIFVIALVAHFVFGVVPLSFWPLMSGTALAIAIWRRRTAYRWPLAGVVGGALTGVTAAVVVPLAVSDVAFLLSFLPAGVLVVTGTRPSLAEPVAGTPQT
ncbi:hypothetical protein [Kineosporia sp. R_H_3]|uniref:hypothetical protein n=1 Tax=Kineosporia sp. R_H_3 TaxID=1961848 RepID=UPI000B4AC542|nr:hypothetical protein [Kineosporia sp. R_H_3]